VGICFNKEIREGAETTPLPLTTYNKEWHKGRWLGQGFKKPFDINKLVVCAGETWQ